MARAHLVKNNVRELRKAQGLTQQHLAEKLGVHFTTIAKIERAERGLSIDMLTGLARVLGVRPIDIISGPGFSQAPMRTVPLLGAIAAGDWKEAMSDPDGEVQVPLNGASEKAFALKPESDSLDLLVGPNAIIVIDPEDLELRDGKVYAVRNGAGQSTFKRFRSEPMRLEPMSSSSGHEAILLGQEPFTIIGRIVWQISEL